MITVQCQRHGIQRIGPTQHTQRNIEHVLQPLRKRKRNRMPQMHRIAGRPASRVQEKRLPSLIPVQDPIEVAMGEKQAPSEPAVWLVAGEALEAQEKFVVDQLGRPFPGIVSICA